MKLNASFDFSLIGFPDDIGIRNVGGRLGAGKGPAAFRSLYKPRVDWVFDQDIQWSASIEENHLAAKTLVSSVKSAFPIVMGGGHDYAAPWLLGLKERYKKKMGCLNIDAHFDLRNDQPVMTSGSPFFRAIEQKWIKGSDLVEFGIQDHCNKPELWAYAKKNKVSVVTFKTLRSVDKVKKFKTELTKLSKRVDHIALSVDLDALSYAFAPGVSAPQAEGFTASELFAMLEIAAKNKKVVSLGFFELSPPNDVQDLTARLAAQAVWHFKDAKISK